MHSMGASRGMNKVDCDMAIDDVTESCALEMALAVEFRYWIRNHLGGKFGRFGVHVNRTYASVWLLRHVFLIDHVIIPRCSRDRNRWTRGRSFRSFATCITHYILYPFSHWAPFPFSYLPLSLFSPVDTHSHILHSVTWLARATLKAINAIAFIKHLRTKITADLGRI